MKFNDSIKTQGVEVAQPDWLCRRQYPLIEMQGDAVGYWKNRD